MSHYSTTKKESIRPGLSLELIDSVRFSNNSLDNLVKNLVKNDFCHLYQEFNPNELTFKKGFSPCDYWDRFEKFKEGSISKSKFEYTLANCKISDKNYVWKAFKRNSMKDYHNLHLKDDAFDPYLFTFGFSWDAMLRFTNVNLKLISNTEK